MMTVQRLEYYSSQARPVGGSVWSNEGGVGSQNGHQALYISSHQPTRGRISVNKYINTRKGKLCL